MLKTWQENEEKADGFSKVGPLLIINRCKLTWSHIKAFHAVGCRYGVSGWRDSGSAFGDRGVAEESICKETGGCNGTAVSICQYEQDEWLQQEQIVHSTHGHLTHVSFENE